MLRQIICFTILLYSCALFSQSISYSIGYGLPRSQNQNIPSTITENYNKGQEFSISLGLNSTETVADQIEIRLSTYESTLDNTMSGFIGVTGQNLSIRKYIMELQSLFYKLNLKQLGGIEFGSKISILLRSDIDGFNFVTAGNDSKISSFDYMREGKLYVSFLTRYSTPPIRLNSIHKLKPSYTFSYSFNRDVNSILVNSRLINHIFELTIISALSKRK